MLVIFSVGMMSVQASSLISSLILVPTSVLLMVLLNINFVYSGLVSYIFIMIFIGGLMVLLVSVTSTVSQEQSVSPSMLLLSLSTSFMLWMFFSAVTDLSLGSDSSESIFSVVLLLDLMKSTMVFGMLLMLFVCLFVLTKLLLEYQGLTRSL